MPGDIQRPRCNRCEHYWITFDTHFRYGCRAMGFKSRQLPERDVIKSSGQPCLFFTLKPKPAAER